jgi:P27 family predicted phage terminase small subunit
MPTNMKIALGNPGKRTIDTEGEAQPPTSTLTPPDLIAGDLVASDEYRRVGAELLTLGLVTKLDETALTIYAVAYSTWVRAVKALQTEEPLATWGKGGQYPNPWFKIKGEAEITMERMMTQFGMTPSARSRLKGSNGGVGGGGKGLVDQVVAGETAGSDEIKAWEPPKASATG